MENSKQWQALSSHFENIKNKSLAQLFAENPNRGSDFSLEACGLYVDYSKNHIEQTTLTLLSDYLNACEFETKRKALFTGEKINTSENRAALHTALRDLDNTFQIDGKTFASMKAAREKTLALAQELNQGKLHNENGEPFQNLVCLGIGGSYLGPKLVLDALSDFNVSNIGIHFIASIDSSAFNKVMEKVDIKTSIFLIASKSFNTLETLTNAKKIKQQLLDAGIKQTENYFIAATSNTEKALAFPCKKRFILDIDESIGGRFSLWSSVGFPIAVALRTENFLNLLKGAHTLDKHFYQSDNTHNLPVILALIAFWYQNFFNANTRAVIPYSHALKILPAFLQQLEMESLGKTVSNTGKEINYKSGAIIWGSEGPNSQHSFHQLLMQGTHIIPCDFIAIKQSENTHSNLLILAQCLAQSRALAFGNSSTESKKKVQGNQASNTLLLENLDPETLGSLLALYEHKVFVESVLLDINAFDQWGVELGKQISKELYQQLLNTNLDISDLDSSTKRLISIIKNN